MNKYAKLWNPFMQNMYTTTMAYAVYSLIYCKTVGS